MLPEKTSPNRFQKERRGKLTPVDIFTALLPEKNLPAPIKIAETLCLPEEKYYCTERLGKSVELMKASLSGQVS